MFRLREWSEIGEGGPTSGAAALGHAQIELAPPCDDFIARYRRWRDRAEARMFQLDLAPDLAEEVGSRRWFRGFATMLALSGAALVCWPDLAAVAAAPDMRLDRAARDEFRSQAIQPLALGGDTGRRMGATARVAPLSGVPERASLDLVATLGQGDGIARMLARAGVGPDDAGEVAALVATAVPPGEIQPGRRFAVRLGKRSAAGAPRALEAVEFRARFDLALGVTRAPGGLTLIRKPIAVDATPLRIRGVIGNGLYRSARAAGAPIGAIQQYLMALDAHLSLDTDMQPGDTYDIVVAYKRSARGEAEVGNLLFAGLERGGKPVAQLLRWGGGTGDGQQFFEASGMGGQRTGLLMPVVGRITSGYGARRHPVLGYTRMHAGVDFGAAYGSPIYAVGDGVVSFAGWHGGHGNYVRLEHGTGFGTGYGHMSRIAVASGTRVRAGQIIGYVGSTGPHLHYELYQGGRTVNPLSVKFTVSQAVDANELAAFKAKMAALKAVKPGAAFASLAAQAPRSADPTREIAKLGD